MSFMFTGISVLAAICALSARFITSDGLARAALGLAGVFLAACAGLGMLFGTILTGHIVYLFIAEWVVVAVLIGILSRKLALGMVVLSFLSIAWLLYSSAGLTRADLIAYFAVTIGPLLIGSLIPGSTGLYNPVPKPYVQTQSKKPDSSTDAIVNSMSEGVITLDNQGTITLVNPAAEKISGWSRQDALNLNYKSVLKLVDKTFKVISEADDPIARSIQSGAPVDNRKYLLETKSEKRINLSIIVTPTDEPEGGAIVVFRDITSELAEESSQAEFISTASHEMRTPVASIEGYLGLALNPSTAQIDAKARDFITKAHEAAQHLGELFQDLLDITKADDGLLQNNPEPIDLAKFTADVIGGLKHKATEKSLRLSFAPDQLDKSDTRSNKRVNPTYYVRADKNHLREVIANLTENAIKYTLEGYIKVDISGDNEHVVLSFADTGIGIPDEDAEHLFQKFYRVDNSDTREIGGTGLGLYLVRRLVETMGGRIWVESEYRKGSTFFVQLDRLDSITAKQQLGAIALSQAPKTKPNNNTQAVSSAVPTTPQPPITANNQLVAAPAAPTQPQPQAQTAAVVSPRVTTATPNITPAAVPPAGAQQAPLVQPQQPLPAQAPADTPTPPRTGPIKYNPQQYQSNPSVSNRPNTPLTSIERDPSAYQQNQQPPSQGTA